MTSPARDSSGDTSVKSAILAVPEECLVKGAAAGTSSQRERKPPSWPYDEGPTAPQSSSTDTKAVTKTTTTTKSQCHATRPQLDPLRQALLQTKVALPKRNDAAMPSPVNATNGSNNNAAMNKQEPTNPRRKESTLMQGQRKPPEKRSYQQGAQSVGISPQKHYEMLSPRREASQPCHRPSPHAQQSSLPTFPRNANVDTTAKVATTTPQQTSHSRSAGAATARAAASNSTTVEEVEPQVSEQKTNSDDEGISDNMVDDDDPFDIVERFVRPHRALFATALGEIRQGRKESHWMWYLFPTPPFFIDGVEAGSTMNRHFALRTDAEVVAFLQYTRPHVDLRQNYMDLLRAVEEQLQSGTYLNNLFPYGDHKKAVSSVKLFERVGIRLGDQDLYCLCRRVLSLVEQQATRRPRRLFKPRNRQPWSL